MIRAAVVALAQALLPLLASEVALLAPLTTEVAAPDPLPPEARAITATIVVPADAPDDLGVGAFIASDAGHWYQRLHPSALGEGVHELRFALDEARPWTSEAVDRGWTPAERHACRRYGLFLYSARPARGRSVTVGHLSVERGSALPAAPTAIRDLSLSVPVRDGHQELRSGERWWCRFRPTPYPADPYDPAHLAIDLELAGPGGVVGIPAFHREPMDLVDRGDGEAAVSAGAAHFEIRWRPRTPGRYLPTLVVKRAGRTERRRLPPIEVVGPARDPIVRISDDPRFWATGDGEFYYPIGLNLSAVSDARSRERYGTRPTPMRGSHAYRAYFRRLAAHGATVAEVWLSTWNLSLEWNAARPGYHGLGRYHQGNAARLDAVLDAAWAEGMRLVINLRNHGQYIRPKADESEWPSNPYNAANGGPCATSDRFFDDETAWAYQQRLRRYQAARYADHPAVLTWKLFSEIDLTDAGIRTIRQHRPGIELLVRWHERAAAAWRALDAYDHPVSTHFATDMHNVHPAVAGAAGIDAVLLDAYHRPGRRWQPDTLAELMSETMFHRQWGCARYRRPVLITEYGGALGDHSRGKLAMEHRTGMWAGLVSGHAGAPMLWWYEWVDHDTRYSPYRALSRYLADEDLRGAAARSVALPARSPRGPAWCRAWVRPGHLLGYAQDRGWATSWGEAPLVSGLRIDIGAAIAAGAMRLEWWDADRGELIERATIDHPGGRLEVLAPDHAGHIAFKLVRRIDSADR